MTATTAATEQEVQTKHQVPLKGDATAPMLLNVEAGIKDFLSALAKKGEIKGAEDISEDAYAHFPNSITGVAMHLIVAGMKAELDISFDENPKSMKQRGNAAMDRKVAGKKRLLTREQKNELLAKTSMSYYETKITAGEMTIDEVMFAIKDAFERKKNFEEMGYILPEGKTKYPYWEEDGEGEE